MSKGYMTMFAESRILPREPYDIDGRKYVDCVVGDVSTIRTYRRDTRNLTAAFSKKLKEGLVLTPTHGYIVESARLKKQPIAEERIKTMNVKTKALREIRTIGKSRDSHKALQKDLKKDFERHTRDNDKFHNVFLRFICESEKVKGVIIAHEYKYTAKITSPVIRALVRCATSRTLDELKYDFKKDERTITYDSIVAFLTFVRKRVFAHTPDEQLRQALTNLATEIDDYMNPQLENRSGTLVGIHIKMSKAYKTFEEFSPPLPEENPLALTSGGRFFYSEYLTNDITMDRDDHMMMNFETHTGLIFRENSCLASAMLYICFADGGRPVWCREDRFTEKRQSGKMKSTALPVPTYESLAALCGGVINEDGSLVLSLRQIEPFLEMYRTHCYCVSTNGKMTFCRIHPRKKEVMPILRLVQHHEHVRLIDYSHNQKLIQSFDYQFLKLPQVKKQHTDLMRWDFDVEADMVIGLNDDAYHSFDIRSSFEKPLLALYDPSRGGDLASEHATAIRNELIRVADDITIDETNAKKKSVYGTIHYPTDCTRLLVELKTKYGIVGGRLVAGGCAQSGSIHKFKIQHKHITLSVGNVVNSKMMKTMTTTHQQDATRSMTSLEDIDVFNKHYRVEYEKLLCRNLLSKYSSNFLTVLRQLRCSPLGFTIGGTASGCIDQNKAYSTLLCYDMKQFPVFDEGCDFIRCEGCDAFDDYTLYVVKSIDGCRYSIPQRIILDKSICLYYGIVLKKAIDQLGVLPFHVWAYCRPRRIVSLDFADDMNKLYDDKSVPIECKKNIVNCLLGCLDKFIVSKRFAEWHSNEGEANSMLGITPMGKRIEIPLLAKQEQHPSRPMAAFLDATKEESINHWMAQHEDHQQSLDKIYLNVSKCIDHRLSEGFLPISHLKYQLQRLRVLTNWLNVENSNTLVPIGVRVDAVYCSVKRA